MVNPLTCPVPPEVPLTNPPLKLALAQIRFPANLGINQPDSPAVAAFQKDLGEDYPNYQRIMDGSITLNNIGEPVATSSAPRHVFKSDSGDWGVSLTQDFVSLTTISYQTKDDFAEKVHRIAESIKKCVDPHHATRLGIRFFNRIEEEKVKKIDQFVNPVFLGPLATLHADTKFMITKAVLVPSKSEAEDMIIHWGYLPPNQPSEFQEIQPCSDTCWILDSDIQQAGKYKGFDPDQIAKDTMVLTERTYAFFRYVFNDEFLISCGGKP